MGARLAARQERLFARGAEVAVRRLHAYHAMPAVQRPVRQLQACVIAAILEARAQLPAFDLVMAIIGQPAAKADFLEPGERVGVFGAQVGTVAAQLHIRHVARAVLVPMIVFRLALLVLVVAVAVVVMTAAVQVRTVRMAALVLVVVAGQAVLAFEMGECHADVAARRDP